MASALLLLFFLSSSLGLAWAQCPPDSTSIMIIRDQKIHLPLTEPICIICRFFNNQGNFAPFSDGVWWLGSMVLNDGDYDGNVSISSTFNTVYLTLHTPDAVVNVGDVVVCSSKNIAFLNPIVFPNGTVNVIEGSNLTLTCSDPGNAGTPRYVWIRDGSQLTIVVNNPPLNLYLTNIDRESSGEYTCRSMSVHMHGDIRETSVRVNVISLPTVNIITHQNDESITINCTYDDSVNVTWEHNNSLLEPDNDPYVTVDTQSSYSELTISPLAEDYKGEYQCIVSNDAGTATSEKVQIDVDIHHTGYSKSIPSKYTAIILVIITACVALLLLGIVIILTIIVCLCCRKYYVLKSDNEIQGISFNIKLDGEKVLPQENVYN
uniref:Ig-like domain-containing protein n=1 Tax=Amphimedon queenslandica TaxID=400682 RepID=A0A1X7UQ80_AMPQE